MKKTILALVLIMSMGTAQVSWASSAPQHRYHPATEQVGKKDASTDKKDAAKQQQATGDEEGVEAYSDTTSTDTAADDAYDATTVPAHHSQFSVDNYNDPFDFIGSIFGKGTLIFFILLFSILGLLLIFAPFIIIWLIVRYMMRRHNDRIKLAEMAMEKGINIPESQRPIDKQSNEYLVKRGLRNAFLGAGLCAMFAFWGADFLAGIGALVVFYGIGQTVIGSLPAIRAWWYKEHGNADINDGAGYHGDACK